MTVNIGRLRTENKRLKGEVKALKAAVRGLLPRGWRDGAMDHMPGIKAGRLALGLYSETERKNMAAYHGDIDGDFDY